MLKQIAGERVKTISGVLIEPSILDRSKIKITKPIVCYNSKIKRTVWENFVLNCEVIDRNKDYVKSFLEKELLTTSSVNQSNQLLIRGRYDVENRESLEKIVTMMMIQIAKMITFLPR